MTGTTPLPPGGRGAPPRARFYAPRAPAPARRDARGARVPAIPGYKQNVCPPPPAAPTSVPANNNATSPLRQPVFLPPRHTASFAVFAERRSEFKAYTRQAVGANLAVTFNARRDVPVTVGYSYSVGRTTAEPAVLCERFLLCNESDQAFLLNTRPFGAITISGVRARVNSVLDPSAGSGQQGTLGHAPRYRLLATLYECNGREPEAAKDYPPPGRSRLEKLTSGIQSHANLVNR